jgi:hypothetical protein
MLNKYRDIFYMWIVFDIFLVWMSRGPTESWLKHVPAAAVRRERQALFVINGSKGYVGGLGNL